MRFLHAADIHLDSPLKGLRKRAGTRGEELAGATREAFKTLVQYAIDERVDLLLISGDNYDGKHKDFSSLLFFSSQMLRLREAGIRVVMIRGNHDAENNLKLTLPDGVHVLPARRAETIRFDDLGIAVHGQSFASRAVTDNLSSKYPDALTGMLNIGMLHTAVEGHDGGHDRYAPCTIDDLTSRHYDYWALGHVHTRTEISNKPWIVYPGNLQARHIKEPGAKGATLVTVESGKIAQVEHVPMDVVRWDRLEVGVAGLKTIESVASALGDRFRDAVSGADGRTLATRVVLKGATPAHGLLKAKGGDLDAEVTQAAEAAGEVWIETIEVLTTPETVPASQDEAITTVIAAAEALKEGRADRKDLLEAVSDLPNRLNTTLRQHAGLDTLDDQALDVLIDDAKDLLLGKLTAGTEG